MADLYAPTSWKVTVGRPRGGAASLAAAVRGPYIRPTSGCAVVSHTPGKGSVVQERVAT